MSEAYTGGCSCGAVHYEISGEPVVMNHCQCRDCQLSKIAKKGDKTEVRFTHVGLVPGHVCYGACSNAWGSYINGSLRSLITTGKGQPNEKENAGGAVRA
jgi:hypothetical protein